MVLNFWKTELVQEWEPEKMMPNFDRVSATRALFGESLEVLLSRRTVTGLEKVAPWEAAIVMAE